MNILELFAGTKSISKIAKQMGYEVFTSDINPIFQTHYCVNILDFDLKKLPWQPDVVWASPPCESFSVASIGKHWYLDNTPKTLQAEKALLLINKTLEIINELNPRYWYIENPRGKLRKLINPGIRHTVSYCQYGDTRMKPTDIWTNNPKWMPRKMCKNGMTCHIAAPRGSSTGTQGIKTYADRSRIPKELCEEILKSHEPQV